MIWILAHHRSVDALCGPSKVKIQNLKWRYGNFCSLWDIDIASTARTYLGSPISFSRNYERRYLYTAASGIYMGAQRVAHQDRAKITGFRSLQRTSNVIEQKWNNLKA